MKASYCDECIQFKPSSLFDEVCMLNHKPKFYLPKGNPYNMDWGWKRVCSDFQKELDELD